MLFLLQQRLYDGPRPRRRLTPSFCDDAIISACLPPNFPAVQPGHDRNMKLDSPQTFLHLAKSTSVPPVPLFSTSSSFWCRVLSYPTTYFSTSAFANAFPPPKSCARATKLTLDVSHHIIPSDIIRHYPTTFDTTTTSRMEPAVPSDVHPAHAGIAAPVQSGHRGRRAQAPDGRPSLPVRRVRFPLALCSPAVRRPGVVTALYACFVAREKVLGVRSSPPLSRSIEVVVGVRKTSIVSRVRPQRCTHPPTPALPTAAASPAVLVCVRLLFRVYLVFPREK